MTDGRTTIWAASLLAVSAACGPRAVYPGGGGTGGGTGGGDPTATFGASSTSGSSPDPTPPSPPTPPTTTGSSTGGPPEPPPLPDIPGDLPAVCENEIVEGRFLRPQIVLVLDQSSSMNLEFMFEGQLLTRWSTLVNVVHDVVTGFDDRADFGAELFPNLQGGCSVDDPITVPVAPKNAAGVLAGIPAAGATTNGSTPLGSGVSASLDHLAQIKDLAPQALILMADGGVSWFCPGPNSNDQTSSLIANAFTGGVSTYVVSIGAASLTSLEPFAQAGGVPKNDDEAVYFAEDGDILLATLEEIVATVIGCAVEIGQTPAYPELVEVTIDGAPFPRVGDCEAEDGWMYGDTFDTITLCGAACPALEESGIIDFHLSCP